MPSTRPGPSNASKHIMSDPESAPQDSKKPRRNTEARRDANRDAKRRRRKKRKTPIVTTAVKADEDGHPRAPLSVRNQVIRFTSPVPDPDFPPATVSDVTNSSSSNHRGQGRTNSPLPNDTGEHPGEALPSTLTDKTDGPVPVPSSSSLQDKVTGLETQLKSKDTLIASHRALLNQIQQSATCQICLDLMYRPYALAPCGHLACHGCLVNWFTAPPPDNRPAHPAIMRKKSCPHCRAVIRERPVEVWSVKNMALALGKSGLLSNQLAIPAEADDGLNATVDPWLNIFPKSSAMGHHVPWFFPGPDIDDDDIHIADGIPHDENLVGMLDMEDGGIYRCLECMHEIWDGVCSSCGRVYPGHRPGLDEDYDENPMGWLEDQMGAEEVDITDDPGWMGLEDGEADDDGADIDRWQQPYEPWRRHFHMFRGPWGFLGTIHVDEEDDEEDDDDRVDGLGDPIEEEESVDEGYESSFIDDDDECGGAADFFDGPRFYEFGDDEDHHHRHHVADPDSDDQGEHEHEESDVPERGRTGCRLAPVVVSSDEERDESEDVSTRRLQSRRQRFDRGIVESDGSDAHWSDE